MSLRYNWPNFLTVLKYCLATRVSPFSKINDHALFGMKVPPVWMVGHAPSFGRRPRLFFRLTSSLRLPDYLDYYSLFSTTQSAIFWYASFGWASRVYHCHSLIGSRAFRVAIPKRNGTDLQCLSDVELFLFFKKSPQNSLFLIRFQTSAWIISPGD